MSNYTRLQSFAALKGQAGDPTVFDTEFDRVVASSATKADKANPTFTGVVVVPALSAVVSHATDVLKTSPVQSGEVYMHSFPTGTSMAFFQATAPVGWTQSVVNNDAMLRVVSGAGGGTGGAQSIIAGLTTTAGHAITIAEMPAHTHTAGPLMKQGAPATHGAFSNTGGYATVTTSSTGGGGAHTHAISWAPKYIDMIICVKD